MTGAGGNSALPPSRFRAGYTAGAPAPVAGAGHGGGTSTGSPAPTQDFSGLATVSLVLVTLLGVFVAPVTTPMALVARAQIRRTGGSAWMANAAAIVGTIYLLLGATAIVLWFVVPHPTSVRA
jgi:hypothetical protein